MDVMNAYVNTATVSRIIAIRRRRYSGRIEVQVPRGTSIQMMYRAGLLSGYVDTVGVWTGTVGKGRERDRRSATLPTSKLLSAD